MPTAKPKQEALRDSFCDPYLTWQRVYTASARELPNRLNKTHWTVSTGWIRAKKHTHKPRTLGMNWSTQNVKNPIIYFRVQISGLLDKSPLQLTLTQTALYYTCRKENENFPNLIENRTTCFSPVNETTGRPYIILLFTHPTAMNKNQNASCPVRGLFLHYVWNCW